MSSGLSVSTFIWLALLVAPTFIILRQSLNSAAQTGLRLGEALFPQPPKCYHRRCEHNASLLIGLRQGLTL